MLAADGKDCPPCRHHTQNGHHLTFQCPLYEAMRRGTRANGALDGHLLIKDPEGGEGEQYTNEIELFFTFIFAQLI